MKDLVRHQLNFYILNEICKCCCLNGTLPSFYTEKSISLAVTWDVWGFPWDPFSQWLNERQPTPCTGGFTWWWEMSSWGSVSSITWWLHVYFFNICIYLRKTLVYDPSNDLSVFCPSSYFSSLTPFSIPVPIQSSHSRIFPVHVSYYPSFEYPLLPTNLLLDTQLLWSYELQYVPCISHLSRTFIMKVFWILPKTILASNKVIMKPLVCLCDGLHYLSIYICWTCSYGMKPICSEWIIFLICSWFCFESIFLRVLHLCSKEILVYNFLFFCWVQFMYLGNCDLN